MFPIETTTFRPGTWPPFLMLAVGIAVLIIAQNNEHKAIAIYIGIGILVFSIVLCFFNCALAIAFKSRHYH